MDKEEAIQNIKTGHIIEGLTAFALYTGAEKIKGIWEKKINDQWIIKCNGTTETIFNIPPFSWSLEYNGWPAGILDAITGEGVICGGELANEETLRTALIKFVNK